MCPLTSIKGWRLLRLPTFERFPLPHLLEALNLPFKPPTLSAIRVSLLECDREKLCLLPVSLTLELSSLLNIGSGQVSRQVSTGSTATALVEPNGKAAEKL